MSGISHTVSLLICFRLFLQANYYIIIPTAHLYSGALGARNSAALIIGAANISSLLSLMIHSLILSKRDSLLLSKRNSTLSSFRLPLSICSASALAGNILYSYSLTTASLGMALVGRVLVGFGSAEVLNKRLLSLMHGRESINTEVASLAKKSMIMTALALFLGSMVGKKKKLSSDADPMLSIMPSPTPLANLTSASGPTSQTFASPIGWHGFFSLRSIGYVMSIVWAFHLIGMLFFFESPESKRRTERETVHLDVLKAHMTQDEDFDSDTETYEQEKNPPDTPAEINAFMSANTCEITHGDGTFEKLQTMSRKTVKHQSHDTLNYRESIGNIRQTFFSNVAFPTAAAVLFIAAITSEVLLSSCGTIALRYFNWSGAR